jgi:hypothetical protein
VSNSGGEDDNGEERQHKRQRVDATAAASVRSCLANGDGSSRHVVAVEAAATCPNGVQREHHHDKEGSSCQGAKVDDGDCKLVAMDCEMCITAEVRRGKRKACTCLGSSWLEADVLVGRFAWILHSCPLFDPPQWQLLCRPPALTVPTSL